MPDVGFGGNVGSAFSQYQTYSTNAVGLPTGRAMSDGGTGALITALGLYLAGRSGAASAYMTLGSASTTTIGLGNGGTSSHPFTGYYATNSWFVNGGVATVSFVRVSGTINFGRSSTSGAVGTQDTNGTTWSGILGGAYSYVQGPLAPTITSVVGNDDGDTITVDLAAPGDNGGTAITGYRIQRADDAGFTTGVSTVDSTGTSVITSLTPGATYYLRATARNAVTNAASKLGGPWSATSSITMADPAGGGRRWNGTVWESAAVRQWSGSAWVDAEGRRYNGSTWDEIGD